MSLVKLLYKKGFKKEDVLNLYRFLDWIMILPKKLSSTFHEEVIKYEEEQKMPFITTAERIGIEKGIEKGELIRAGKAVVEVLETRFDLVHKETIRALDKIKKIDILEDLHKKAVKVESLEEFDVR